MTAQKIRTAGLVFEAKRNGDVEVQIRSEVANGGRTVPHLDTIRLAYWLTKQYIKAAARRSEGAR